MTEPNGEASDTTPMPNADVVSTRVNVAFPFSQIKIQEPSEDLVAIAALVSELADVLADVAPESTARDLAERARALVTRLQ